MIAAVTGRTVLKQRIARTIEFLRNVDPARLDGAENREVTFPAGGGTQRTMNALDYFLQFSLPNFWFHATTAYAILRHNGVELGKADFLGVSQPAQPKAA